MICFSSLLLLSVRESCRSTIDNRLIFIRLALYYVIISHIYHFLIIKEYHQQLRIEGNQRASNFQYRKRCCCCCYYCGGYYAGIFLSIIDDSIDRFSPRTSQTTGHVPKWERKVS
jgi:hypothetical protein